MKKAISLFLLLTIFVLSGCVEIIKPTVATVNGKDISIDEYKIFLGMSLIPAKMTQSEEYWATEKDGKNTFELMKESAFSDMITIYTVAEKAKQEGMSAEFTEISAIKSQLYGSYGLTEEDYIKESGSTSEAFTKAAENLTLYNKYLSSFAAKPEGQLPEEELLAKYNETYLSAKHILIMTQDATTGAPLSDEEKASKKALAEEILAKATPANFDSLVGEYSEDPGSVSQPDGYVFTDGEMVPEFENAVKELEIGGISGIVETSYGYHIILRQALPTDAENENYQQIMATLTQTAAAENLEKAAEAWKADFNITENKKEIDKVKR